MTLFFISICCQMYGNNGQFQKSSSPLRRNNQHKMQMTILNIFFVSSTQICFYEFKQLLTNLSYFLFLHFAFLNYYFSKSNSRFNRVLNAEVDRRYLILNYEFRVYFCARDLQQLTHMCTLI